LRIELVKIKSAKRLNKTMKKILNITLGLAIVAATASCSADQKKIQEDYPEGEAGTSRAIVGDDPNLAKPRPAPIGGDTAKTPEQANQLGEHNVENVDSVARGLK
jgi:hypothetical protein